jgi:L-threonylcarbamoyladenylate synthase
MPPIEWNPTVDPSGLVRQARALLAAGAVVVVPGDCGPVAIAKPDALPAHLPERAILCWGPDEATALGLSVPPVARRLLIRCWPAPLVLEVPAPNGFARLRCPEHPVAEMLAQAASVAGPWHVADAPDGVPDAALTITAALQPGGAPTLVRVTDTGFEILRDGAFPRGEVERLSARIITFVCTGNTCRSPLAEALAKVMLAQRLGCTVSELPARGFWVLSAGVAASHGDAASPESVATAAEHGADLSRHASRPVNPQLVMASDDVICMTRGHMRTLEARYSGIGPAPRLLCGEEDLDDPIGAGPDVYRACATAIRRHLDRFLSEWVGA